MNFRFETSKNVDVEWAGKWTRFETWKYIIVRIKWNNKTMKYERLNEIYVEFLLCFLLVRCRGTCLQMHLNIWKRLNHISNCRIDYRVNDERNWVEFVYHFIASRRRRCCCLFGVHVRHIVRRQIFQLVKKLTTKGKKERIWRKKCRVNGSARDTSMRVNLDRFSVICIEHTHTHTHTLVTMTVATAMSAWHVCAFITNFFFLINWNRKQQLCPQIVSLSCFHLPPPISHRLVVWYAVQFDALFIYFVSSSCASLPLFQLISNLAEKSLFILFYFFGAFTRTHSLTCTRKMFEFVFVDVANCETSDNQMHSKWF